MGHTYSSSTTIICPECDTVLKPFGDTCPECGLEIVNGWDKFNDLIDELPDCPWCGSSQIDLASLKQDGGVTLMSSNSQKMGIFWIDCEECMLSTPHINDWNKLIKKWNSLAKVC